MSSTPGDTAIQKLSAAALLKRLKTSEQGLTGIEARRRLAQFGPNEPAPPQRVPFIRHAVLLVSNPMLLHTGWFVESLATQTLVLFVIRTAGNPLRSRPSLPLAATTLLMVAIGIGLPYSPLAPFLGFVPLPGAYFLFLAGATGTYLLLVEIVKHRLIGRLYT